MIEQAVATWIIGVALGFFIGVWASQFAYQHSRLKKMQDEYDEDRKRIRQAFEDARKKWSI